MKRHKPKIPARVTLLALLVLTFTVWNALRLYEGIRQWAALQNLVSSSVLGYLAMASLFWALTGATLTFGLIYGKPWARRSTQIAALFYAAWYWFDRLLIANPAGIAVRWPFALGLTFALLAFTFWALATPKARKFFGLFPEQENKTVFP